MEIEHVTDLIPAFALGCLDEDEAKEVKQHLESCSECSAELRAYQKVVDHLSFGIKQFTPPPEVKERLLEQVALERVAPEEKKREGLFSWLKDLFSPQRLWQVASVLAILILLVVNLLQWQQNTSLRAMTRGGATAQAVSLTGTDAAPKANGFLVINNSSHATLVVNNLPVLPESKQYQLWLIKNGQRTSGGVFSVNPDGTGSLLINSPQPFADYKALGVTIEPKGGSASPTGEKVLGGDL
ncbi:MAG TPA: anti-sigma factor [Anaerolineaceae bacterium]